MAKKPVHKQQDVIRKDGGTAVVLDDDRLEIVGITSERVEYLDTTTLGADTYSLYGFDAIALDSDGKPRLIVPDDTPFQGVHFILPRPVLIALLDAEHELADAEMATGLGLLHDGELTAMGKLVIEGTDKTALGHKMAAVWRAQHNAEVNKKG